MPVDKSAERATKLVNHWMEQCSGKPITLHLTGLAILIAQALDEPRPQDAAVCAFCGAEFRFGDRNPREVIDTHLEVCPRHPIRNVERERDEAIDLLKKLLARQAVIPYQARVVEKWLADRGQAPRAGG